MSQRSNMPFVKETTRQSPLGKKVWSTRIETPEGVLRTFKVEGSSELEAKRNAEQIKRDMRDKKYYQENRHLYNPPQKVDTVQAIGMIACKIKELGLYKNDAFNDKLMPLLRNECRLYLGSKYKFLCEIDRDNFFQQGLEQWVKQRHKGVVPKLLFSKIVSESQSIRIWEYLKNNGYLDSEDKITNQILTDDTKLEKWVNTSFTFDDNGSDDDTDVGTMIKKIALEEFKKKDRDEVKPATMNNKIKGIKLILTTGVSMNLLTKCPVLKTKGEGLVSSRKPITEEAFIALLENSNNITSAHLSRNKDLTSFLAKYPNKFSYEKANGKFLVKGTMTTNEHKELINIFTDDVDKEKIDKVKLRADNLYLRFIVMLFWFTGMRKKEVFNLQLRDIDLATREITVRADVAKNNKERIVLISNHTLLQLLSKFIVEYYDTHRQNFIKRENPQPKEFVFRDTDGNRITSVRTALVNLAGKCNLKNIFPHAFRHSYVTQQANKGGSNIKEVAKLVGHTDTRSTVRYLYGGEVRELRSNYEKCDIDLSHLHIAV